MKAFFARTTARRYGALGLTCLLLCSFSCRPRNNSISGLKDTESVPQEFRGKGSYPIWAYDAGPDPQDPMGRELIDINASIPYFPGLSEAIYGDQMFRPAFGPIPWRMLQKPDSVKILFIGQDGTHIAEAAGRPATAGFGGRAQDLAKYFGVGSSAAFINTFAFTIRWQYGNFDTPIVSTRSGKPQLSFGSFTGNQVWMISQHQDSPLVTWRNRLIDWIIRNNRNSLKLIVLFGGGARDAAGSYILSKGRKVDTKFTAQDLKKIQIPEFELTGAGSNKQTAFILNKSGGDLYQEFLGQTPDYKNPAKVKQLQDKFRQAFNQKPDQWTNKMVFSNGGLEGSGMLDPAQLGGYDIASNTSLKGLKISDDLTIDRHILVAQLPHPTALSMKSEEDASAAVAKDLAKFEPFVKEGWYIEPDPGVTSEGETFVNTFAQGKPYKYARADMGAEYYDFGAPNSRMVNVSTASRSGASVIIFGTRDKVSFDQSLLKTMTNKGKYSEQPPTNEMWISRATSTDGSLHRSAKNRRYTFDAGPGPEMAQLMKSKLQLAQSSFPNDPQFKARLKINGDFAHYRGTFQNPQVVILADPDGEDDLITARALTGSRGQYLHGLMQDLGVQDQYLVIKSVPYSTSLADGPVWEQLVTATAEYREALLNKIFEGGTPRLIITDGKTAEAELKRILPTPPAPVLHLERGNKKDDGIKEAENALRNIAGFEKIKPSGRMMDLPRSHLSYYSRVWEGTSGDRVITAEEPKYHGIAFAEVAPYWAFSQKFPMSAADIQGCKTLIAKQNQGKLRFGGEEIQSFLQRQKTGAPAADPCNKLTSAEPSPAAAQEEVPAEPEHEVILDYSI